MGVSSMTSESSDPVLLRGGIGSPCADEVSSGGNLGGGLPLKKGPWTTTEDAILLDYVTKHGEGNWNAVQKHSGLARCGKSCRLRWANHLRPDLRKGAFTPEEERRIVELHAKMGNKWARMSLELPGRTDNEIKNYWNTRIKRRQRAGLPIYPPDICLQAFNESKCENISAFSSGNSQHPDLLPIGGFEFPAVEFKGLDVNHQLYSFPTVDIPSCNLLDVPTRGMLAQGVNSSYSSKNLLSAFHPPKRFRRSESFLSSISPSFNSSFTDCNKIHRDGSVPNLQSFGFSSDNHQNLRSDLSVSHGFHGIPSFSEPTWAMKLELPSLQIPTETRTGSWGGPSSPLPSLESLDTLIQSPPPEHTESGNISPRNSGLLDAVLNESRCLRNVKSDPCEQKPNVSIVHEEGMDKISYDQHEAEWDLYPDPISPLGHSSASVFSIYTPVSGSSLDEAQSFETFPGSKLITEGDLIPTEHDRKDEMSNSNGLLFSRPDFLLASDCLGLQTDHAKSLHVERYKWSTW